MREGQQSNIIKQSTTERMMESFLILVGLVNLILAVKGYNQKPIYHLTPEDGHWINDPNGLFYDPIHGKYHVFAQYNPNAPYWGDMSWTHWISDDMVTWKKLSTALINDQTYDIGGAFSGSAIRIGENETPVLVYTCVEADGKESQCYAISADASDPEQEKYKKADANPVLSYSDLPAGSNPSNFRDPTLWRGTCGNNTWTMAVAAEINGVGNILNYDCDIGISPEIFNCKLLNSLWKSDNENAAYKTYMVECPDFYKIGPNPFASGKLWVLKYSIMEERREVYELGRYDDTAGVFNRDTEHFPLFLEYDYGPNDHFYASKRFDDAISHEQILFGWSNEHDDQYTTRNWAGVLTMPRKVQFNTELNILRFLPFDKLELLHETTIPTLSLPEPIYFDKNHNYLTIIPNEEQPKRSIQLFPTEISSLTTEIRFQFNVTLDITGADCNCLEDIEIGVYGRQSADGQHYIKHGVGIKRYLKNYDDKNDSYLYSIIDTNQASGTTPKLFYQRNFPNYNQDHINYIFTHDNGKQRNIVIDFQLFYDHSIIELFLRQGDMVSTLRVYPDEADNGFSLYAINPCDNDQIIVQDLQSWNMRTIWNDLN